MPQDSSMCLKQKPTREESVGVAVTDSFRKYSEHIVNTVEFAIILFKYSLLPHNSTLKAQIQTNRNRNQSQKQKKDLHAHKKKSVIQFTCFSYFFLFKPDVNDLDMT